MIVMHAMKVHPSEADIQSAFVKWCQWNAYRHPALASAYRITNDPDPSGVRAASKKLRAIRVAKARKAGLREGMPDFCIPFCPSSLYIEFKSATGKVSPAQSVECRKLKALGHHVHIAFSLESAIAKTEEILS